MLFILSQIKKHVFKKKKTDYQMVRPKKNAESSIVKKAKLELVAATDRK